MLSEVYFCSKNFNLFELFTKFEHYIAYFIILFSKLLFLGLF